MGEIVYVGMDMWEDGIAVYGIPVYEYCTEMTCMPR